MFISFIRVSSVLFVYKFNLALHMLRANQEVYTIVVTTRRCAFLASVLGSKTERSFNIDCARKRAIEVTPSILAEPCLGKNL